MSGKATGWVLRNGPAGKGHRAILVAIADEADIYGENARIGWRTIAERTAHSRSRTAEVLRDLINDGWIEIVEPGGGRGNVAVYRLPRAVAALGSKGPVKGPENRTLSDRKGSGFPDGKGPVFEQIAEVIPLLPKTVKPSTVREPSSPSADVVALCDHLADRIAQLQGGARPEITNRWRDQMRLLIERGPLHRERPEAMTPGKIRATIDCIFDDLAEPEGNSTFCWADQIRSVHALRDHWDQMKRAARKTLRTRHGRSAAAIDAAMRRPTADPLSTALSSTGQLSIGRAR